MKKNNFLITGNRQIGKSTLVQKVLSKLDLTYTGFKTIPLEIFTFGCTYALVDLNTNKHSAISSYDGNRVKGIPTTFSSLGVDCLRQSLNSKAVIVMMDELGRFERNNDDFISCVNEILDSDKIVIAVLKAESIEYLNEIKARNNCFLYDLNQIAFNDAYDEIISKIQTMIKELNNENS